MLTVGQSVRILSPEDGVDALRRIEYAGRNCYRSHDRAHPEFCSRIRPFPDPARTPFATGICGHDRGIGHLPRRDGRDHPAPARQFLH